MLRRIARKHAIVILEWALVRNHHHLVVKLTEDGLSQSMRELHGGYSRWFHAVHEETRKGHLFRHAFFARRLKTEGEVIGACAYVSSNLLAAREVPSAHKGDWSGYRAIIGLEHPRAFHAPHALLQLIHPGPARAREIYRQYVAESHARRRLDLSPNDVPERA